MNKRQSEIKIHVSVDENQIPDALSWTAADGGVEDANAKAVILSIWEPENKETMRIDLWTKDMPVQDMHIFLHQTLLSLADTMERATNNDKMAAALKDYCAYYLEQTGLRK
ncbi:MAG: gliding motility protein GldC [Bacteroidetes bacterium]|nr:gliding motility protein GldC [Bacteroidota bacterium]